MSNERLDIAVATSRKGPFQNKRTTWRDIVETLSSTERTKETVAQYFSYTKDKQDAIKDVGGFVGGYLREGKRRNGYVEHRQIVALDVDYEKPGCVDMWLDFREFGNAGMFYTTHKHTNDSPRYRIVFPLNRKVNADEYEAIARTVASWLGIDSFDDTTYQPARLMYYPSTSKDGEFLCGSIDGPFMDADDVLASLPDWQDPTCWPVSSRVKEARTTERKARVEDPNEKTGIVGAFCHAYTISEAIAEFLDDVYTPCDTLGAGRFTYVGGSTSGGLVVYDDTLAYSWHSTDPAGQRTVNAFDLVRLHKFGELDAKAKNTEDITRMPSYKAMVEFATNLKAVKRTIAADRRNSLAAEYDTAEDKAIAAAYSAEWVEELETNKNGTFKSTINNIVLILTHDELLAGAIGFNEFEQRETALKALPWDKKGLKYPRPFIDSDESNLRLYLERAYGITGTGKIADGLTIIMRSNMYHPPRTYLDALAWDGTPRVEELLIKLFGAEDTPYVRAVTRKTLAAAVARIYVPGIKFDHVLTLLGDEGTGKSSMIDVLANGWYTDSVMKYSGREGMESIQGSWLVELAELAGLKYAEDEEVKHFVSKREDKFRVAYGKRLEYFLRTCIFIGTSNKDDILKGINGNRRWWIVNMFGRVGSVTWKEYLTPDTVAQIWAEAKEYYANGEKLYLDSELESYARDIQDAHLEKDDRAGIVREFIDKKLPKNWATMDSYERRAWLDLGSEGTEERKTVSCIEIWVECYGKQMENCERRDSLAIARILKTFRDWVPMGSVRIPLYGAQKIYAKGGDKGTRRGMGKLGYNG